jgi:hypothetical protein
MSDVVEVLRTMADNIDATRPEYDYSLAHKRIDDADTKTLREAANLIEALRKANAEVFATGIKSVRDVAELAIELRETKRERDEARRIACEVLAAGNDDEASEYARLRNWDCFAHTEGAPEVEP